MDYERGTRDAGIGYVVNPKDGGGGGVVPDQVTLTSSGLLEFTVSGGSGPVTGTATVPSGASVQIQVGDGPQQVLKNGPFSVGG